MDESGKIFVSYSHKDTQKVLPVIILLREAGLDVWYDDQLTPGVDWNEQIAEAIKKCVVCLYFVSESSVLSPVCEREVGLAIRRNRHVLPIYLEDVELSPQLELGVGNLQAVMDASVDPEILVEEITPIIQRYLDAGEPHPPATHVPRHATPHRLRRKRKLVRTIAGLVVVTLLLLLTTYQLSTWVPFTSPKNMRIAVLVFKNFSGDATNDYLGSGIAEELIDAFAQIDALKVAPRSASFYYHNKDIPFSSIVDALDVDIVLEGSLLSRESDKIRIATQLVDVATDSHIWSKIYETRLGSLFDIKQDIILNVLDALDAQLPDSTATQLGSFDGKAYDLYLKGKDQLRNQNNRAALEQAVKFFTQSLEAAPDFGPSIAGICQSQLEMYVLGRSRSVFEVAEQTCSELLSENPSSMDALVALGTLNRLGNNVDVALGYYERALLINGIDEPTLYGISRCYEARKDFATAEQYAKRAIEAEPNYWKAYTGYAGFLFRQGRYREAAGQSRRVTELTPDNPIGWGNLGTSYFANDMWEEAADPWRKAFELQPTRHGYGNLASLYYYQGQLTEARDILETAISLYPEDYRLLGKLAAIYRLSPEKSTDSQLLYKRAFDTTSGSLSVNADDAVLLGYHAYFAAAIGLSRNARDAISRAQGLQPHNPEVFYLEAYVRFLLDDPQGWREPQQKALELGYSKRQAANDPMFEG